MDIVYKEDMGNMLDKIMDTIEATFEQANVALPERRYIYFGDQGETVHDCEQLTVSLAQVYQGLVGQQGAEPARCDTPLTGVFFIELVRCVPDKLKSTPKGARAQRPDAADLSMNARVQGIDAYLLMLAGLVVGDEFLGSLVNVSAGPSSGGYQAVVLELATAIQ